MGVPAVAAPTPPVRKPPPPPPPVSIIATATPHGRIMPSGLIMVPFADSLGFTVAPEPGYHIDRVVVDGRPVGKPSTYVFRNARANHTISVDFAIDNLKIAVSTGPNGSISPARVPPVRYGESVRFRIQPKVGYHLDSLLVDGAPVRLTDQLMLREVIENRTVRATFEKNEYTIVASAGPQASISPSGPITVKHGTSQTFILSAAPGYTVREVVVDGKPIRAGGSYTLSNIQDHHTVVARVAHGLANFVSQAGDEVWTIGEVREVHWQPLEAGLRDTVELRVSYHGDDGPWIPIWRGPLRAGSAEWKVAAQETDSLMLSISGIAKGQVEGLDFGNRLIRVRSASGSGQQGFYLRISPSPVTVGPVRIEYRLPVPGDAALEIYSVNGRQVWRQALGYTALGEQSITWDGRLSGGDRAGPGVYFARLVTGRGHRQCRLVVLP